MVTQTAICARIGRPIMRRAGDHHVVHPGQDLFTLSRRTLIEVVGQMPLASDRGFFRTEWASAGLLAPAEAGRCMDI